MAERGGGPAAGLGGIGRALSSCLRLGCAVEANPGCCIVDSKHWATPVSPHCCGGERLGGTERGEAAGEGRPGRCGAGHARLEGHDGTAVAGRGSAGGGGTIRQEFLLLQR